MIKKILHAVLIVFAVLGLNGCSQKQEGPNTVRVGTISGPETQLMQVARRVAKQRYGLNVKIIVFSDYNTPNAALAGGSLDANAFQHIPYLKSQIKSHHYNIVAVGKTFLYPMGLYSNKIKSLSELSPGAKIAIPNDPSNESRALLLLQNAKLIKLRNNADINATPADIVANPKKLQFVALDAAELPRALSDVSLAAINTNYAIPAGLSPAKEALFIESSDSPYTNVIAVRADSVGLKKIKEFVAAFQSQPVVDRAKLLFGDGAIPVFTVKPE